MSIISDIVLLNDFLCSNEYKLSYKVSDGNVGSYPLAKDRKYVIPGYQREIQWGEDQIRVLINDLQNSEGKFLGHVFLSTKNDSVFDIIDGQQRITILYMILFALNKKLSYNFELVSLQNNTFPFLDEELKNDFADIKKKEYQEKDTLHQFSVLSNIWKVINNILDALNKSKQRKLLQYITDSKINLLVEHGKDGSKKAENVCVDYFIDINNKGKHLDHLDILKAYAFKNIFDDPADKWAKLLKEDKKLETVEYPIDSMILHYLLCKINEEIDNNYKETQIISNITDSYQLDKKIVLDSKTYNKGTNIEELIKDDDFYENMLINLLEFYKFMNIIVSCGSGVDSNFKKYFDLGTKKEAIDNDTITNIYFILNDIIKNKDVIPKLLVMKFFVEIILKRTEKTKADFKIIYPINVLCSLFSAGTHKDRGQLVGLIVSSDWENNIKNKAQEKLNAFSTNISFSRTNKEIKNPNPKLKSANGQNLAKRLHALSYVYGVSGNKNSPSKFKENKVKEFYCSTTFNCEHFYVNQSLKISHSYKGESIIANLDSKFKSKMTHISNYLMLDKTVNTSIGNKPVNEKIKLINEYITNNPNKQIFQDSFSEKLYESLCENFQNFEFLEQNEIEKQPNKDEAEKFITTFYNTKYYDFISNMKIEIK